MKGNTDSGLPPKRRFLAVYECSCNHPGEPQVLKWVHHENETIRLLYASRSDAVSAHCLLWIDRSPIEPLHFGDFSIFDYTAIEIRMRRFPPPPPSLSLVARLRVFFLIARWNWHSGCHLSSEAFQSAANCRYRAILSFHCVWLHGNTAPHCAREEWSIIYRVFFFRLIASKFLLLPGFKCRRNCYSLFWTGYSVGWGRDA